MRPLALLLWPGALLLLLLFQPSVASECRYVLRDAFRCSGAGIHNLTSLGIPNNVTQMLITGTSATELTDGLFSGMNVLQLLFLSSNQLAAVSPGSFKSLVNLKTLKLDNNRLKQLPKGVFDSLVHLQQLVLENNQLSSLQQGVFDQLHNLQELLLNKNLLTALPAGLFRTLTKLKELNLSRNQLVALPRGIFSTLSKLEKLFLYANQLASIESGLLAHQGDLLELRLHSCAIQSIAPGTFHSLLKLQVLTLSGNRLLSLPAELFFHLHNVSQLTLYRNPLQSLPRQLFGQMPHLRSLWLYETGLSTLPAFTLSNLTQLELLVLTRNPHLSVLAADAFHGLTSLQVLSLHTNNLSSLTDQVFRGLERVQEISLFGNQIRRLPPNVFRHLRHLQTLYLNSTGLHSLHGDVFTSLPSLQKVWLDGNPWHCYCELAAFAAWLRKSTGIVQNATAVTCRSPLALEHTAVLAMPVGQLACLGTTAPARQPLRGTFARQAPLSHAAEVTTSPWQSTPGTSQVPSPGLLSSSPSCSPSTKVPEAPGTNSRAGPSESSCIAEESGCPEQETGPRMDTTVVSGQRRQALHVKGPIAWWFFSLYVLALLAQAVAFGVALNVARQARRLWRRRRNASATPVPARSARAAEPGTRALEDGVCCTVKLVLPGTLGPA